MDFELQQDFAAWIDRESPRLPALVEDLTGRAAATRSVPINNKDDRIVAHIPEGEVIGEIIQSQTDIYGRLVTRFFQEEGRILGLTGAKLVKVLKFAERISSRKELRDIVSADTIREIVLDWIGATVRKRPTDSIVGQISETVQKNVKPLDIWIPIEETQVDGELPFADAILRMASLRELDALMEPRLRTAPPEAARLMTEKLHRIWRGKAAMCFSFEAEPKRAQELAFEKAEIYMALLQLYGPAALLLELTS